LLDQGADLLVYEDAVGHAGDGSECSGALKALRRTVSISVRGELSRFSWNVAGMRACTGRVLGVL
jgi:hypothetical protein